MTCKCSREKIQITPNSRDIYANYLVNLYKLIQNEEVKTITS